MVKVAENISIYDKKIAITGCTGGLGRELCFLLAERGARLIMLNRNPRKTEKLKDEIRTRFPKVSITDIEVCLEDMDSVKRATQVLIEMQPDVFISNAGVYHVPRYICASGYDNVFQINFLAPYYMAETLRKSIPNIKIVVVGSIAYALSKTTEDDVDFGALRSHMKVYGNSKRWLMLALNQQTIVHPGISYTNILHGYPPIFAKLVKYPMKVLFLSPRKAAHSILQGVEMTVPQGYWMGPSVLGIWGKPKILKQRGVQELEVQRVRKKAQELLEYM